nr:integrase, catalytic region, zinc finger, CCHC-type, peptidase aspartic, catalytic [Tanacetum cinerariifolium]
MPNPEYITDPTTAMNMALVLMAKTFNLNYSTPTNNNQRILSNLRNRQIDQPGMNMVKTNKCRWLENAGNPARYNDVIGNQVIQNAVQNPRVQKDGNQNGLIAGSKNRPLMLNKENYVPWSSRLLRYAKSRPNEKLIHNSIINGPYVRRMIPELCDPNCEVPVNETFHVQTDDKLTEKEVKQIEVDDQAIQTILLGLPEDIYAEMFTSTDEELIESYYHRFLKLMNDLKRNKHFPEKIASNLKFLNNLKPEWSRHVTIVHQTNDLHTADYTQLYDFLKYNQKEVDDLKAEGLEKTQDPLALMVIQNTVQNPRIQNVGNQNGLIVVPENANQNLNGNGNLVAARAKGNLTWHNGNQIRCYNYRGLGIQLQAKEFDLMAAAADLDEIEEINYGSAKVHNYENCYDNEIFNMFTQEDQYTELLEPIPDPYQDTTRGTSANTKFAKQSILGKPPFSSKSTVLPTVGETHALSNPVTSNSIPTPQELKVLKNDKVIASRMFSINPFKPSREEKYVPNNVRASVRKNPITISRPPVITKKVVNFDSNGLSSIGVDNTTKTRRPQPRSNTKNDRAPSASKSSCSKNKEIKVEEHPRNLLLSKNKNHMSSKCNNVKLATQNVKSKVVCAMCKQCLISVNHDVCLPNYVNDMNSCGHNLFSVKQFCDSDLEVAFRKNTCFVRNLEGVDLLKVNRTTNLYTINLHEMASASPICLMARASSTKSWLRHQRVSHLNFDTINDFAKNNLVTGLPKFKYHKEHLFPSYEQEKSKRASHPPKPVPNSRQRLHLLHMDLCGPMRIASINGKKNQTLVEAARTMLIFSRALLFLWAEAIATAYFTQNHSIIHLRFNKTPYELINGRKPDISFLHVFGALCYPKNDREDIRKLGAKVNIGFFIGYSADLCAYRVYNQRTKKIMETMNLFKKVSDQKDNIQDTSKNTKFAKQPIVEYLPKVGKTNALSNPVTSNSVSSPQESKGVNNDKLIAPGMFRINPSKTSRDEKHVPNIVSASARTKSITVSQPHVITKKDVNSELNGLSFTGVDNTKTRRPQPRSNTKNDRVPSTSKSSRSKNKEAEVEEHHRNLLLSKNNKHISLACNNIKIDSQDVISKVVCAKCKKYLISVNHDKCLSNSVNAKNSCGKNQKAKVYVK